MDEILAFNGSEVKALGGGKIGGYLVQFSDEDNPDLSSMKDFFSAGETDFDFEDGDKRSVFFNHGLDASMKSRRVGRVEMKADNVGVWVEGILNERDAYEKALMQMAIAGKLSWSSGAPAHLVQREPVEGKNAHKVLFWPIAEASLTHTPADYRNTVIAIKSASNTGTMFADLLREIESEATPADAIKTADEEIKASEPAEEEETGASADVIELLKALPIKTFLETMGTVFSETDRRIAWYAEQRAIKQGRAISSENLRAMSDIADGMDSVANTLDEHRKKLRSLVESHTKPTEKTNSTASVAREFSRYLAIGAQGAGARMTL